MSVKPLTATERVHYRDIFRAARYAALADAEGFHEACYALEALGKRLLGSEASLGRYREPIECIARVAPSLSTFADDFPRFFTRFEALYDVVHRARNDAMHGGSYARHATGAAIELCLGLEEAVMGIQASGRVRDYMVKSPYVAENWHLVAHIRQVVLTHSFSFLPVLHDGQWKLVSEMSLVAYLQPLTSEKRKKALAKQLVDAIADGLRLVDCVSVTPDKEISEVVRGAAIDANPRLWLVVDDKKELVGVLSPFELM